jgi:hypothetical protein
MRTYFLIIVSFFCVPIFLHAQNAVLGFDPSAKLNEVSDSHLLRIAPKPGERFHYQVTIKTQVSIKNSDELFNDPTIRAEDKAGELVTYYLTLSVRSRREDASTDFLFRIDSLHERAENNGVTNIFSSTQAKDIENPAFGMKGIYAGHDFGVIVDTLGDTKDVYGYYEIVDHLYGILDDSLQTAEERRSISSDTYSEIERIFDNVVAFLPIEMPSKDSSLTDLHEEDYNLWSDISFPVKNAYKGTFTGSVESGGRTYARYVDERTITPTERTLNEKEYTITLPSYNYSKRSTYFIDIATGLIAADKWTKDEVFGIKLESKAPETLGKTFAAVQRTKVETTVELLK